MKRAAPVLFAALLICTLTCPALAAEPAEGTPPPKQTAAFYPAEVRETAEGDARRLEKIYLEYLRSILQVDWLPSVRRVTFVPIVVLSDTPERDLHSLIHHGVDICISSKQAPFLIADIILSQLRRYTEYNHFNNPENAEAASFQAGDIFIDPPRRMVKVRGQSVNLRPREFSLLLYFMRNINIVLTSEQICEHAWGMEGSYKRGVSGPIAILRKIIETDPTCPRYIETVSRIGYRFTAYHSEICDNYSDDEVAL
ncbi:response regulator transcription factor [Oscillibacter sp. MSJ-31]|uniref:winged helix-turn-helix domain-containing protein n=1 Tax=Oscillibacter sp. MSJ-31 TaxID=2841526 RepID=UPI001C0F7258|nr:response regulator transcription factor [Oscillibacter sp. MSJ-31]MBU5457521.1 response regulator transcription factor [Oscillibacter sp. MSJ-31]